MLSVYEPPSDPAEIERWLLTREEEIAEVVVARLTAIIDDASTAFTNTLTAAGDMSVFDSVPIEWSRFVTQDLGDRLGGMYLSGGVSAWVQAPGTDALPESTAQAWTNVVNENAVSYASQATNRLTGPVADSIWNDLRLKVSKAIETGVSTERLTQEIALNRDFAIYRAQMIARTEVNGAYNAGNYQSNQALGDMGPVEKYWMATGDDRTRQSHREADGQVRAFDQPFIVGGSEMMYPHDPSGPASEVVNCRCVTAYLYPGMTRPDGTIVPEVQIEATPTTTLDTRTTRQSLLTDLRGETRVGSTDRLPAQDRLVARLTDEQKASVRTFTGSAYEDLNYAMRTGGELTAEQRQIVQHLDEVIAEAGVADEPYIVYRGMRMPAPDVQGYVFESTDRQIEMLADVIEQKYRPGSRVSFGGQHASASTDVAAPLDATLSRQSQGVLFEIETRRGAPINDISRFDDEFEVILPRNVEYEVVAVERRVEIYDFENDRTDYRTVVQLREIL
jgi:hypothetical protein